MKRLICALCALILLTSAPRVTSAIAEGGGFFLLDGIVVAAKTPPEDGVRLKQLSLGLGEAVPFYSPDDEPCAFSSSKPAIAAFNGEVLNALKKGDTYVRATLASGEYAQLRVNVRSAPTSVSLNARSGRLAEDDTYQMTATLSRNSASLLTWASSDSDILQVDSSGLLLGVNRGQCVVTVTTFNGLSASCDVTVTPARPAEITLNAKKGTLHVGEGYQMTATLTGGRGETVSWVSGDERILSVDDFGYLTAVSEGVTRVRALASGGNYADCIVTVKPGSTGISIDNKELKLYVGGVSALSASVTGGSGAYTLESADESVAIITEDACVCALSEGSVIISAYTPNGIMDECTLTVYPAPDAFGFIQPAALLCEGDELLAVSEPSGHSPLPIEYMSDAPGVAAVDALGTVMARDEGVARIRALSGGLTAYMDISVTVVATGVNFASDSGVMGVGDTFVLAAELTGGGGQLMYVSSNPYCASVDARSGYITALSEGASVITASLKNGVSAEYTLSVVPAPRAIILIPDECVIGEGDSVGIQFTPDAGSAASVTWQSGDESVITINDEGVARSMGAPGSAIITATTHNGVSGTAVVRVAPMPEAFNVDALALAPGGEFDAYVQLSKGATHALNARVPGLTRVTFAYESSYTDIAPVDGSGVISGLEVGTSLIVVTSYNGVKLRVLVEVV